MDGKDKDKFYIFDFCGNLEFFRMSKKDGKSSLLHSEEKRGFHTVRTSRTEALEGLESAERSCPVKIIKVSLNKR